MHNFYRCMHGVPLMKWDASIAANAQKWAARLGGNFGGHSGGSCPGCPFNHVGENIAWGSLPAESVSRWYDEIGMTNGGWVKAFGRETGHYTQVVWKGSTTLGCGWFERRGSEYGRNLVCQYGPAGNMQGAFNANVNAPKNSQASCQSSTPPPMPMTMPSPQPPNFIHTNPLSYQGGHTNPLSNQGGHTNPLSNQGGCECLEVWTELTNGGTLQCCRGSGCSHCKFEGSIQQFSSNYQ